MKSTLMTAVSAFLGLWLGLGGLGIASAAGPAPEDLKKLRLAHIDPPIKAPEFRLMDLDMREVSLSEFGRKGVVVYFWASW